MNETRRAFHPTLASSLLALAMVSCDSAAPEAPLAGQGGVEVTSFEPGSNGTLVASATQTLSAEAYAALVQEKRDLMARAAATQAGGLERHQQRLFAGNVSTTQSQATDVPGSPCNGLDVWFYDITDGWLDDGRPRRIGCFRNPGQHANGCTETSIDRLDPPDGARHSKPWSSFPTFWGDKVRSIWGGPCQGWLLKVNTPSFPFVKWAQVNTPVLPWSTLFLQVQ